MGHSLLSSMEHPQNSEYWMRAVSFAGLHRIVNMVAGFPNGLKAGEINKQVRGKGILLTRRNTIPALSTLYHYRNILLNLRVLKREGPRLLVNDQDPDVSRLLLQPMPDNDDQPLGDIVRNLFSALVLKNEQCRSLFFDLFMPLNTSPKSVADFQDNGMSVKWSRSSRGKGVLFRNDTTGRNVHCTSPVSETAILYGVRYWARDELKLIDEYCKGENGEIIMFPVFGSDLCPADTSSSLVQRTVQRILSLRTQDDWTLLSISDLVVYCCEAHRQPVNVLFRAIDWLIKEWPHHIVLIPSSRSLATVGATSPKMESMILRTYYKTSSSPYISHMRIHKKIPAYSTEITTNETRYPSKIQA